MNLFTSTDALADGWAKALGSDRKQFEMFLDKMIDGFAYHKIIVDKAGKPVDYVFLEVNHAFEAMTGLKREKIIGKRVTEVLSGIDKDPADWSGIYGSVALTGEPVKFENHAKQLDKWFKVSAYCPEKGYFIALFEDITERKMVEQELRKAKNDWELTFDSVPDFIAILDNNFRVVRANRSMAQQLGVTPEKAVGLICFECVHGAKCPPDNCPHAQLLKDDKEHTAEVYEPRLGGDFIVSATPLLNEKGQLIGSVHVARDITERKKAEAALRYSEQLWSTTLSSIGDAVIATDISGRIMFMNAVAEQLTGWTLGEASLKPVRDIFNIVNELTRVEVEDPVSRVLEKGMIVGLANHTVLIRKNKTEVAIDDSGAPIKDKEGRTTGVVLVFRDITERKKQELEIENLAKFPSENPDPVFRINEKSTILYSNQVGNSLLNTWNSKVGEHAPERISQVVAKVLSSNKRIEFEETYGAKIFSLVYAPVTLEGYVNIYAHDITERKKAEEKLEEYKNSLEKLVEERTRKLEVIALYARNLIEASLDPLVTINVEGKITDVNKATETATGCSRKELIGSDFSNYFTEPEKAKSGYKQVFTEGFVRDYPLTIRHKSGKTTDVLYNATVYTDNAGEIQGVFAAARDITELKKAEKEAQDAAKKLKDSERLATIGITAGMVGHDIRNPLQAISGDIYLAKTELASTPESEAKKTALESLDEIEKSISYINKIVVDLQDFAKPLAPRLEEIDLEQTVHLVLATLDVPEKIDFSLAISKDFPKLKTDPTYIRRILTNLSNNAIQAMPKGGKLSITAAIISGKAVITVEDTGGGIPENVRSKIFTPLETTKAKGQGFGLPVVKRFTEALGGTVRFESEVGKGTKFIIELAV